MASDNSHERVSAFLSRFESLLKLEREADYEASSLLLTKCSTKQLEKKGLALNALGVASTALGLGGKILVELDRPLAYHTSLSFPPHTFRPGDLARIEDVFSVSKRAKKAVSDVEKKGIEGVVYRVSETRIVVAVDSEDQPVSSFEFPEKCTLLKLANTVTYDRMDKVIRTLQALFAAPQLESQASAKNLPRVHAMHRVLMGLQPLSAPSSMGSAEPAWFDSSLNASQREAVQFALGAPEIACIWGPPGTGKTHTLIELILQLLSQELRVLVCGASNLSVDNILERLVKVSHRQKSNESRSYPSLRLLRISHPARTLSDLVATTLDYQAKHSEGAELAKDCKDELEKKIASLTFKGGPKSKGGKLRLSKDEKKKGWEEVRELRKEYRKREKLVVSSVVHDANVVLATCHSAGSWQLANEEFDVLIVDEATQAMEPVCWIPILKAKKLVLAGDPKQLPPTVLTSNSNRRHSKQSKVASGVEPPKSDHDSDSTSNEEPILSPPIETSRGTLQLPRSLSTTLFTRLERMYGSSIKRMLQIQYRMHERIASFPANVVYESKLQSHDTVKNRLLLDLTNGKIDSTVLSQPLVFFDTAGMDYFERADMNGDDDEGSKCNENEATLVVRWVETLIANGIQSGQIAIITPYQAQVQLISSLLRPRYPQIQIGSVDGMQGREEEVVIVSLVRSNNKREVGFLRDKRRLNVAMTRAKRQLCVIGDSDTIKHGGSYLKRWMVWLENEAEVHYAIDNL